MSYNTIVFFVSILHIQKETELQCISFFVFKCLQYGSKENEQGTIEKIIIWLKK